MATNKTYRFFGGTKEKYHGAKRRLGREIYCFRIVSCGGSHSLLDLLHLTFDT